MQQYKNLGGDSNISAFLIGKDYVEVQFNGGTITDTLKKALGLTK